jgi:hypothetical protein
VKYGWLVVVAACGFRHGTLPGDAGDDAPIDVPPDVPPDVPAATGPCAQLSLDPGAIVVSDVAGLTNAIATAPAGATIALAPATYVLTTPITIHTQGLTLISMMRDASSTILDGGGAVTPVVRTDASNVTVASLTIAHSSVVGMLVQAPTTGDITGVRIYDVTFDDDVGPSVRVHPNVPASPDVGPYADNGTIACSRFVDTSAVDHCTIPNQLGIDAVAVRGWTIRDNRFDHVVCPTAFRRAILIRGGSRDVVLANNRMLDSNGNITLGDDPMTNPARMYSDALPATCSAIGIYPPQVWGGVLCNNAMAGLDVPPYAAQPYDDGISLWGTCETWALHNTIVSPAGSGTFHDIEYRFPGTYVHLVNNLVEQLPASRDAGAQDATYSASDVAYAAESDFVDPHGGDLHLSATAAEGAGASIEGLGMCGSDADGKPRNLAAPVVGAYER